MAQVKLICICKGTPGQTREEFEQRWLKKHSVFAASWKNVKSYRVLFPDPEVHDFMGEGVMFDGIGELIWDSKEEMKEDFESDRGKEGFADAALFIDSFIDMYCVEHIFK